MTAPRSLAAEIGEAQREEAKRVRVDALLWDDGLGPAPGWPLGDSVLLPRKLGEAAALIRHRAEVAGATYILLWQQNSPLPAPAVIAALIASGAQVMHAGLATPLGAALPDLCLMLQDWSLINAPAQVASTSWRLDLSRCLITCDAITKSGGIEPAFATREAAGLDWGARLLRQGAVIEHRPELATDATPQANEPALGDLYLFVRRHYGGRWGRLLALWRGTRHCSIARERHAMQEAMTTPTRVDAAGGESLFVTRPIEDDARVHAAAVSVVIPTLGRYQYLPGALALLRRQTIRPREVIVVDQNPLSERQAACYHGFEDLGLKVIWQDERGQSLARNTGVAAATSPYVFLFDDDSIAADDLLERHLRAVVGAGFDASTGVAYPPPPAEYELPPQHRLPRLAQTFDTGNSLLSSALCKRLGGLDRNYDRGPGTDVDFGTRLYLAGCRILHNPAARRIHFKAPMGGLRTFGAHKYNTDAGLLAPFPPSTQSYYGLRYLDRRQRLARLLVSFATSKLPRPRDGRSNLTAGDLFRLATAAVLLPIKWYRSNQAAHENASEWAATGDLSEQRLC